MSTNAAEAVDHKKAYFEKLFAKVDEVGAKGYTLVVGVQADCSKDADDDDNDSKEDEKSDRRVYTKEQMETLRVILISERRDSYLKKAAKMVTGGQSGYCMMFNTHTGNQTIMGILRMTKTAKSKKALSEKFDALFGLTYQIHAYDFWVSDNELSGPEGLIYKA